MSGWDGQFASRQMRFGGCWRLGTCHRSATVGEMARHPNPRLAKIHMSYTVEEVTTLYGVHRNTVRQWIKRGLPTIDGRPVLVLGRDLAAFLRARRLRNKRPCQPGEIYCMRCRTPRRPAGDLVEYRALTARLGSLVGICPRCEALMYRRVSAERLEQALGHLRLTLAKESRHIGESTEPIVNSGFGG